MKKIISLNTVGNIEFLSPFEPQSELITSLLEDDGLLFSFNENRTASAQRILGDDEALKKHMENLIELIIDDHIIHMVEVKQKISTDRVNLGMETDNLIFAMWAQLAFALSEQLEFRRCLSCDKWYVIRSHQTKASRYCSSACKTNAYRLRKTKPFENLESQLASIYSDVPDDLKNDPDRYISERGATLAGIFLPFPQTIRGNKPNTVIYQLIELLIRKTKPDDICQHFGIDQATLAIAKDHKWVQEIIFEANLA